MFFKFWCFWPVYQVHGNADGTSSLTEFQGSEFQTVVVHTESSLSRLPVFASSFSFQTWHVSVLQSLIHLIPLPLSPIIFHLSFVNASSLFYKVEVLTCQVHLTISDLLYSCTKM